MVELEVIFSGPMRSDCCSHSQYRLKEPVTVKEFCDWVISEHASDWGYIGIKRPDTVYGYPEIEYWKGSYCDSQRTNIDELNFPENILNSKVYLVDWDGGYSRADWLLTLEKPNEEKEESTKQEQTKQRTNLIPDAVYVVKYDSGHIKCVCETYEQAKEYIELGYEVIFTSFEGRK